MTTNHSGSRVSVPTVADLLESTAIGNGQHLWPVQGGTIQVDATELRQALEDAYDASMPDWLAMVELTDA